MIGVIAGEFLAAIGFMLFGVIYYVVTGFKPELYQVFFD